MLWRHYASGVNTGKIDVLIQGAGIAGLSTAVALIRSGFSVRVLEGASGLSQVGAGIWLAHNAMQALEKIGLRGEVESRGWPIRSIQLSDASSGPLQKIDMNGFSKRFGVEMRALRRAELQETLFRALPAGVVVFGRSVDKIQQSDRSVAVLDSSGVTWESQILIGADGIHSRIRDFFFPHARLRYSGQSSYRAITLQHGRQSDHLSHEIWAPGCRLGYSAISSSSVYWYLTFNSAPGVRRTQDEALAHANRLIQDHFPEQKDLALSTTPFEVVQTDLYDLEPQQKWTSGRVLLIGDAAHASTPNLGQGAAQALEDAVALSEEISRLGLTPATLDRFVSRRRGKAQWVAKRSWQYGHLPHLRNPVGRALRNTLIRMSPSFITHRDLSALYSLTP